MGFGWATTVPPAPVLLTPELRVTLMTPAGLAATFALFELLLACALAPPRANAASVETTTLPKTPAAAASRSMVPKDSDKFIFKLQVSLQAPAPLFYDANIRLAWACATMIWTNPFRRRALC